MGQIQICFRRKTPVLDTAVAMDFDAHVIWGCRELRTAESRRKSERSFIECHTCSGR